LQQTQHVKPYTYRAVQAGLFDAIINQKLPPGFGPQAGRPDVTVKPVTEN
jgi:cytochrome o ubiquinol oxidase subunit II